MGNFEELKQELEDTYKWGQTHRYIKTIHSVLLELLKTERPVKPKRPGLAKLVRRLNDGYVSLYSDGSSHVIHGAAMTHYDSIAALKAYLMSLPEPKP